MFEFFSIYDSGMFNANELNQLKYDWMADLPEKLNLK